MSRLVGMILVIAGTLAVLVVASAAFYGAAGGLAWLFMRWGAPASFGAAIANVLTLMLGVMMISGSLLTVAERKWSAMMQNRIGANRIKVFGSALGGIPYLAADALKMLTKERVEPIGRTTFLYQLAPLLAFAPVFALFAIIPVGPPVAIGDIIPAATGIAEKVSLQVASTDTGLLYLFAISSLAVYGTSLAGWASNNKLALLGGVRASSQMMSYEVSLGLALVGNMIVYRTLQLDQMVVEQAKTVWGIPGIGILLQPIGFLIFFASAFAETKRAPFDLPEGESEIVGYFIEYSGMKFGLMFLAEFIEIVVLSAIITAVFLGGWHPLVVSPDLLFARLHPVLAGAICAASFLAKMVVLMWLQLTIRWLLPRFRFDQIQKLCWKILLPAALTNIFVTGAAMLLDPSRKLIAILGVVTIAVVAILTVAVARREEPGHGHGAHDAHDAHGAHGAHAATGH